MSECDFARFVYAPPVSTEVTMLAVGLVPEIGVTGVRLQPGVALKNVGGTSPPADVGTTLTLAGSFGSARAPRIVAVTAADPDNSAPGYSNGDIITIRFDVAVSVAYRNWRQVLATDPNGQPMTSVSGPRLFVTSLFEFSAKLGDLSKTSMIGHARFVCDSSPPLLLAQAPRCDSLALGTTIRPRNDASFL